MTASSAATAQCKVIFGEPVTGLKSPLSAIGGHLPERPFFKQPPEGDTDRQGGKAAKGGTAFNADAGMPLNLPQDVVQPVFKRKKTF